MKYWKIAFWDFAVPMFLTGLVMVGAVWALVEMLSGGGR